MSVPKRRARRVSWMLACGLLAALPAAGTTADAGKPSGPKAPALRSTRWINSPPLTAAHLKGKVVLVEFWTFDCINCVRTLPAMRALASAYPDTDVVIVGVHTPELDHERDARNVERAVKRLEVRYPVAIDNDYAIWRAFGNRYWPALYLIDRRGVIRHTHVGELHQGTAAWDEVTDLVEKLRREPT